MKLLNGSDPFQYLPLGTSLLVAGPERAIVGVLLVEQRGIEPLTSALRTRRSAKLSYCPIAGILGSEKDSVKFTCLKSRTTGCFMLFRVVRVIRGSFCSSQKNGSTNYTNYTNYTKHVDRSFDRSRLGRVKTKNRSRSRAVLLF